MKAFITLLTKIKQVISNIEYNIYLKRWIERQGDRNLRLNYNLNENSVVLDVGGYVGEWANLIYTKYRCKIFIFEPVKSYFKKILTRFQGIPKIQVFNFGLGVVNGKKYIYKMENSSSFYKKNNNMKRELCKIIDIKKFLTDKNLKHIDLMKINIEGGEYELLEKIINSEIINIFNNIQIQFHRFIPNAQSRRILIQNQLSKTHYLTYNYPFIWENWKKK